MKALDGNEKALLGKLRYIVKRPVVVTNDEKALPPSVPPTILGGEAKPRNLLSAILPQGPANEVKTGERSPRRTKSFSASDPKPVGNRAKTLWGNIRAATEAASHMDLIVTPDGSEATDPQSKIMQMAKKLKLEKADRQTHEVTSFFKDRLGGDNIRNNSVYSALHQRGWLITARLNNNVDPETRGMLATHDCTFIRFIFYAVMFNYGIFIKVLSILPIEGSMNITALAIIVNACELVGCLLGGVFGDITGRRRAVNKGASLMITGTALVSILIWLDDRLWGRNAVISLASPIALGMFVAALGAMIMLPPGLVLAAESTANFNREFILCIGFLFQEIGSVTWQFTCYIMAYFDLTDTSVLESKANSENIDLAKRLRSAPNPLYRVTSEDYTNVWPLICVGMGMVSIIGFVIIAASYYHPLNQESYLWKNKIMWLCDIDQSEMKQLVDSTHAENFKKRRMSISPMSRKVGSTSGELRHEHLGITQASFEDHLSKERTMQEALFHLPSLTDDYSSISSEEPTKPHASLEKPLLAGPSKPIRGITFGDKKRASKKTMSTSGCSSTFSSSSGEEWDLEYSAHASGSLEDLRKASHSDGFNAWCHRLKDRGVMMYRTTATYLDGLYEYTLNSGYKVRLEIVTLMLVPFILFSVSFSTTQYSDLFLRLPAFEKNLFPVRYFHYHLLLSFLSLPAFILCTSILIYYTPKLLQLVSLVCSAFIYSGLALSLFGIDGSHMRDKLGHMIHLEDFYYSALSYDAIFQFGLFIPMVTAFIIPIESTHTRVRVSVLGLVMAASRLGTIVGIVVSKLVSNEHKPARAEILLFVCFAFLVMAFLSKANIPAQHVTRYDMPELHTIDLHLDKRFPERKRILLKERQNSKEKGDASISGLYTLHTHSMASRLQ